MAQAAAQERPAKSDMDWQPRIQRQQFAQLERTRRANKIPLPALLAESGVHIETYYCGKNAKTRTRPRTLAKLTDALTRLKAGTERPPVAIKALVLATQEIVGMRMTPEVVAACAGYTRGSHSPIADGPRRALAIYLVAVELNIENIDIANAFGFTRENVRRTRERVEALREIACVDALIDGCAAVLTGRA